MGYIKIFLYNEDNNDEDKYDDKDNKDDDNNDLAITIARLILRNRPARSNKIVLSVTKF